MKKIRKQFIFPKIFIPLILISLALIFCVSTVSAAKIYVNTTGDDNTGTGTAINPYRTIQKGVDSVGPNGVIQISKGRYSGVKNTKITLNKNMTIIGQSQKKTIIDGKGTNWIFKILPGVKVTIYNLTLTNGYGIGCGGAIRSQGNLKVTDCTFTKNIAKEYGGGIYNTGTCTVTGCTITQNKQIGTNETYGGGGIFNDKGKCTIIKCDITYNSANANAGGIGNQYGNCTITNSSILKNHANHGAGIVNYGGNCTITNCDIKYNSANKIGGIGNQYGNCTIINSKIQFNNANTGAGTANANGICTFSDSYILNNTSSGDGGAILNYCVFNENNKGFSPCVLNLNGCTFAGNVAGGDGGAVSNQCMIDVGGSGVVPCVLNLNGCSFVGNVAGGDGGVISNYALINFKGSSGFSVVACVLNLNGCSFVGNVAGGDGGVISNYALINFKGSSGFSVVACVLNLNGCSFVGNVAGGDGGAILNHGIVNINSSNGLGVDACVLNVNHCTLKDNSAGGDGGAILNHCMVNIRGSGQTKTSLNVNGSTFTGNAASGDGGAIWNGGTANLHFNRIVGNTAHRGKAIYTRNTLNATDNWWGSNSPDFKSLISVTDEAMVLYTPWLYLFFTASPTTMPDGSTSILTASFNQHTDGIKVTPINPANGHLPDGTPVTFTTNLGNVGSKSVLKYTLNGIAIAILRGDEGAGIAVVGLIADVQRLYTTVIIKPVANAAFSSTGKTVIMQTTGASPNGIVLAILMIVGGFIGSRKKQ